MTGQSYEALAASYHYDFSSPTLIHRVLVLISARFGEKSATSRWSFGIAIIVGYAVKTRSREVDGQRNRRYARHDKGRVAGRMRSWRDHRRNLEISERKQDALKDEHMSIGSQCDFGRVIVETAEVRCCTPHLLCLRFANHSLASPPVKHCNLSNSFTVCKNTPQPKPDESGWLTQQPSWKLISSAPTSSTANPCAKTPSSHPKDVGDDRDCDSAPSVRVVPRASGTMVYPSKEKSYRRVHKVI